MPRLFVADDAGDELFEIDPDGSDSQGDRLRGLPSGLTDPYAMAVLYGRLLIANDVNDDLFEIDPDGSDGQGDRLRELPSGLTGPYAMTVLNGRLLIADIDGVDLWEIDPDGSDSQGDLLRALPSTLTGPSGMTVLNGRLLIANFLSGDLWEIDPDGSDSQGDRLRGLPSGLTDPEAMAVFNGRLLIADFDGVDLWEIDPDGSDSQGDRLRGLPSGLTGPVGMTTLPDTELAGGSAGVARWGTDARGATGSVVAPVSGDAGRVSWGMDARGATGSNVTAATPSRLFIAALDVVAELFEIDPDGSDSQGDLLRALPSTLTQPFGMTVLNGRLLIADNSGDELFEIDPDGSDSQGDLLRALPSTLTQPFGMTVLNGRLLIADNSGDELWEIDPDGADSQGDRLRALPTTLTIPSGMTVLNGRLLIADIADADLWEIDPDGSDSQGDRLRGLPSGLTDPEAMAVFNGRLLIADRSDDELFEIDPDGSDSQGDRLRGLPSGLTFPVGMTTLPDPDPIGGDAGTARWGTDARGAIGTALTPPLALDDFDDTGREVLVRMLVEAGGSGTSIYREGINGTLLTGSDDDLTSGLQITRLRWIDSVNRWRINRTGADHLSTYLTLGGSDLSVTIQTADATVDLTVADDWLTNTSGGLANFDVDAAGDRTVLGGINLGDRFIFAMWRTIPVSGDAGVARWGVDARGATGSVVPAVTGDAGAARWGTDARGATGSVVQLVSGDAGVAGWGTDARGATGSPVAAGSGSAGAARWGTDARGATGSTVVPISGDAGVAGWGTDARGATGSPVAAGSGSAGAARWGTDARGATGSVGTPLLTLDDFDDTGREVLVEMLVETGGSGTSIYQVGINGTLLTGSDDDLTSGLQINRFRWIGNLNRWRINRTGTDSLAGYLAGAGSDLSLTIQTADATVDLTVADDWGVNTNTTVANFDVGDAGDQAVLAGISDGDRIIFAMWRTIPVSGDAGAAHWGSDARGATGSVVPAVTGDAGAARWGVDARGAAGSIIAPIGGDAGTARWGTDARGATGSVVTAATTHRLFIADIAGAELFEIDPDGSDSQGDRLRELPSGLTGPYAMTVLNGRLLIADDNGDELWEIDPDGSDSQGDLLRALPPTLIFPTAMTVLNGRLLIADNAGDELWEIDPDGSDSQGDLLRVLPATLSSPLAMTVLNGRLLIADDDGDELWEIDPDGSDSQGDLLRALPSTLPGPTAMAVLNGRLLIANDVNDDLFEIDPDGSDSQGDRLRGLPSTLGNPYGMTTYTDRVGGDAGVARWGSDARGATGSVAVPDAVALRASIDAGQPSIIGSLSVVVPGPPVTLIASIDSGQPALSASLSVSIGKPPGTNAGVTSIETTRPNYSSGEAEGSRIWYRNKTDEQEVPIRLIKKIVTRIGDDARVSGPFKLAASKIRVFQIHNSNNIEDQEFSNVNAPGVMFSIDGQTSDSVHGAEIAEAVIDRSSERLVDKTTIQREVRCLGIWSQVVGRKASTPVYSDIKVSDAIRRVLEAVGVPYGTIEDTPDAVLNHFWLSNKQNAGQVLLGLAEVGGIRARIDDYTGAITFNASPSDIGRLTIYGGRDIAGYGDATAQIEARAPEGTGTYTGQSDSAVLPNSKLYGGFKPFQGSRSYRYDSSEERYSWFIQPFSTFTHDGAEYCIEAIRSGLDSTLNRYYIEALLTSDETNPTFSASAPDFSGFGLNFFYLNFRLDEDTYLRKLFTDISDAEWGDLGVRASALSRVSGTSAGDWFFAENEEVSGLNIGHYRFEITQDMAESIGSISFILTPDRDAIFDIIEPPGESHRLVFHDWERRDDDSRYFNTIKVNSTTRLLESTSSMLWESPETIEVAAGSSVTIEVSSTDGTPFLLDDSPFTHTANANLESIVASRSSGSETEVTITAGPSGLSLENLSLSGKYYVAVREEAFIESDLGAVDGNEEGEIAWEPAGIFPDGLARGYLQTWAEGQVEVGLERRWVATLTVLAYDPGFDGVERNNYQTMLRLKPGRQVDIIHSRGRWLGLIREIERTSGSEVEFVDRYKVSVELTTIADADDTILRSGLSIYGSDQVVG